MTYNRFQTKHHLNFDMKLCETYEHQGLKKINTSRCCNTGPLCTQFFDKTETQYILIYMAFSFVLAKDFWLVVKSMLVFSKTNLEKNVNVNSAH